MDFILIFFITFVVFMGVDLIWLGVVAKNLYKKHLGFAMAEKPNWIAALIFYVLFIIGMINFAIFPALYSANVRMAIQNGALYGFFTYMTYDLTNLATLKDWPVKIVVIDIMWGTLLSTAVSFISFVIVNSMRIL